jgi:hypothetical protein
VVKLIAQPLQLEEVANYYNDSKASLRLYFSPKNPNFEECFLNDNFEKNYNSEKLAIALNNRLDELGRSTSLSLLAALEAMFRIDYKERIEKRKKDHLSKTLKVVYQNKGIRASLEEDIFDAWLENTTVKPKLIEDLKGAYKYRHWLAHGRYWTPKMGRPDYDYSEIYQLAENIGSSRFRGVATRCSM